MGEGMTSAGATMTETDLKATAERYLNALGAQDYDTIRAIFDDDVEVRWPQSGEHFKGKESCLRIYSNYPGGSPKVVGISRVHQGGDLVVGENELEYPDGKRYLAVAILRFRDGKIVEETDYFAERFPAPEWRMEWVEHD
jgi:ketosteroid isomerase-like protein